MIAFPNVGFPHNIMTACFYNTVVSMLWLWKIGISKEENNDDAEPGHLQLRCLWDRHRKEVDGAKTYATRH